MRLSWSWKTNTIINKKAAWKKLALLLFAWLFTLTELRAITVTTFIPPKKPLTIVARPSAFMSLLVLDLLFCGSSLSTALILSSDSILEISVIETTTPQKAGWVHFEKFGVGTPPSKFSGSEISRALLMGFPPPIKEK